MKKEKVALGEPLTLERLRKMDGEPVWVERNENPHDGKWFVVDHADTENSDKTLYTKEGVTYSDYGKYFTAYAYPPAHIDREAWEPCNLCRGKQCSRCARFLRKDSYKFCSRCFTGQEYIPLTDYCPKCGRPMTEEAWAELEKRLRG